MPYLVKPLIPLQHAIQAVILFSALLLLALPLPLETVAIILLILRHYLHYLVHRHASLQDGRSIIALKWVAKRRWSLLRRDQQCFEADLHPASVISPYFHWLLFSKNGRICRGVLLLPGHLSSLELKQLRRQIWYA